MGSFDYKNDLFFEYPPGTLISDRYEVIELIGMGGYGRVYKVKDKYLNDKFRALKEIYSPDGRNSDRNRTNEFLNEGAMLCNLSHPNIPEIVDYFNIDLRHYIIMEYIEGETLDEKYKRYRYLWGGKEIISFALEICSVLEYLHGWSVIFRDLKPQNIMIDKHGKYKLIDFGIARHFKPDQIKDTINIGTPGYAAPEQYGKAGGSDARTDIYSLGVILHYLATGEDPQEKEEPFVFSPVREVNSEVSEELEKVINKSIALQKGNRYQTVRELRGILEDLEYFEENASLKKNKSSSRISSFMPVKKDYDLPAKKEYILPAPPKDTEIVFEKFGQNKYLIEVPGTGFNLGAAGVILFLSLWLTGWTLGGIAAICALINSFNCFILVWLCGWAFGEAMVPYMILKMLTGMFGKTSIRIDRNTMEIIVKWAGLIKTRNEYFLPEVKNFNTDFTGENIQKNQQDMIRFISFQHSGKKASIPVALNEHKTNWLCKELIKITKSISSR